MTMTNPVFDEYKSRSITEYSKHFNISVKYLPNGAEINITCKYCGHTYKNINVASDKTVKMIISKSLNHLYNKHKIWADPIVSSYLIDDYIRYDMLRGH